MDAPIRHIATLAAALFLLAGAALPGRAADAVNGRQLAEKWCVSCHVVGASAAGSVPQGPPGFAAVAQRQKSTEQLRVFLMQPHGQMPNLTLSRAEIDDLVAYIETLR